VFPAIEESPQQRTAGVQAIRTFVMAYFRNRKQSTLFAFCGNASCAACAARVGHLNVLAMRKALWLTRTPLARADKEERTKWLEQLSGWRNDPRTVPDVIARLSISKVDYHGLWADVEWEQWGFTNAGKKTHEKVKRRLVRAGSQWFFFDPKFDRDFFGGEEGANGTGG
jgi:hypothetical protein